jgi:hypothetical protein
MAEQVREGFLQRAMQDFATGAPWVPAAPGPTGHARPAGARWSDSPLVKWALDIGDRLHPRRDNRAALRAAGADARARARTVVQASAIPALESVRAELADEGYEVTLEGADMEAALEVVNYNGSRLRYEVTGKVYTQPAASLADVYRSVGRTYAVVEIRSRGRMRTRRPAAASGRAIRRDCLHEMRKALLW